MSKTEPKSIIYDENGDVLIGQDTMVASLPVVIASDQSAVAVTATISGNASVVGTLTNNTAAPAANNLGVLPAIANAAAPTFVEGNQVLASVNLSGAMREIGTASNNGAAPVALAQLGVLPAIANAAAPTFVEGNQVLASVNLSGAMREIGTASNNGAAPVALAQLGVLPAIANAAAPTFVEGNQVLASVNLSGAMREIGTLTHNNAAPAALSNLGVLPAIASSAAPVYIAGDQVLLSTDLSGAVRANITAAVAPSGTTVSGNLGSLNATVAITLGALNTASIQLTAGTLRGTIVPEVSLDNGLTWQQTFFSDNAGNKVSSIVFVANNTATGRTITMLGGALKARVRVSAYTSGICVCDATAGGAEPYDDLYVAPSDGLVPPSVAVAGFLNDTTFSPVTAGTVAPGRIDSKRAQVFVLEDAAGGGQTATVLFGNSPAVSGDTALVTEIRPLAAGIRKAEDDASANGDGGVPAMAIRKAVPANTSGTDGDYEMLQMSAGRLWASTLVTDGTNTATVKAASTAAVATDTALVVAVSPNNTVALTGLVDNTAFVDGTTRVQPVGYVFDDVAGTALTENDIAAARVDSKRAQVGVVEDGTTRARYATVKAASTAAVAADTALVVGFSPNSILPAAALADFASAAPVTTTVGVIPLLKNFLGAVDRQLSIQVSMDTNGIGIAAAGLVAQLDEVATTTVTENNFSSLRMSARRALYVEGQTASGTAVAASPLTTGGRAATANPTAVANAQVVNAMLDKLGKTVTTPVTARELVTDATTTIAASTTETTILAAGGAGVFHDITALTIANTSATAARVDIRSATAGAVRFSWLIPAGATVGAVFQVPVTQAAANTNWTAQSSASITDLRVFVQAAKNL